MSNATWYLGPLGGLRPLPTPEVGLKNTVTRYGGVHQALSGARTMDVTGHRADYTLAWDLLEATDYAWLKKLHSRLIPGPHRLLDPTINNRLSLEATTIRDVSSSPEAAVCVMHGAYAKAYDWPSAAGDVPNGMCLVHSDWGGTNQGVVRFDNARQIAALAGETFTASLWMRFDPGTDGSPTAPTTALTLDWWRLDNQVDSSVATSQTSTVTLTTTWQRYSITGTLPTGADSVVFALVHSPYTSYPIHIAAPQVEPGSSPTAWDLGGGAPCVVVDQLDTSSPRFPYTDCSLTLMEV